MVINKKVHGVYVDFKKAYNYLYLGIFATAFELAESPTMRLIFDICFVTDYFFQSPRRRGFLLSVRPLLFSGPYALSTSLLFSQRYKILQLRVFHSLLVFLMYLF